MALTGDLEYLHIADIIQLVHTTRKSGTFVVRGSKGESRIIFSNGYIVGANHLNNKVRIGTVLVKMNAIAIEDLKQALNIQKKAGKNRKPLIATLIQMGKLKREDAFRGLKNLIEITVVELVGWTKGSFTFDTEAISVSPECTYIPDKMEQELSLDSQMVLMDALRVFDERERDRQAGKTVPSYEEFFADVLPSEVTMESRPKSPVITADDLGLADIDKLERKIPEPVSVMEAFDPVAIHRQTINEILAGFSTEEQEAFASFLAKSITGAGALDASARQKQHGKAIMLFSKEDLIKFSVMTICKNEGILVFAVSDEEEVERIIAQCLAKEVAPILVFDRPAKSGAGVTEEKVISLRNYVKGKYPQVSILQLASPHDYTFTLRSFQDGVRAVFPKPVKEAQGKTFISDMIEFLKIFKSYVRSALDEQSDLLEANTLLRKLKDRIIALRGITEPFALSVFLLRSVSEAFERTITFVVHQNELVGEKAIGVNAGKNTGPTSAAKLKIPLTKYSVFRDVIETGQIFYGETEDEVLREHLFKEIGEPLKQTIIILPMKSSGKLITLTYGDFGKKEALPVQIGALEILAHQAGLILENALYRKQIQKPAKK